MADIRLQLLVFLILLLTFITPFSYADIDNPEPLTVGQRELLEKYEYLHKGPGNKDWIIYGAVTGAATTAAYHVVTSQLGSRINWKWLRRHCRDCKRVGAKALVKKIVQDAPAMMVIGAGIGACNASGASSVKMCESTISSALSEGIHLVVVEVRGGDSDLHFADQVAGTALLNVAWLRLLPRGVVLVGGREKSDLIINGIGEVVGEGLIGSFNHVVVDTVSRSIHGESSELKERLVNGLIDGGISVAVKHLALVLTLGPRFKLSEDERDDVLRFIQAKIGFDNSAALGHTDFRGPLPYSVPGVTPPTSPNFQTNAYTYGNQVVFTSFGLDQNRSGFLTTAAHESVHVRQFLVAGPVKWIFLTMEGSKIPYEDQPLEQVPLKVLGKE